MSRKYNLSFTHRARSELLALPQNLADRISDKLIFFSQQSDPLVFAKKLVGRKNTYRFRIGDYRALFSPLDDGSLVILLIITVAHRKDVYE